MAEKVWILLSFTNVVSIPLARSLLTVLAVVTGTLKGYDALMNLVLDDVKEVLRGRSFL